MIVEIILITSLAVGAMSFYWPEIRNMAAGIKTDIFLRRERQKTLSFERYTAVQSGKEGLPGLNESLGRLINITLDHERCSAVDYLFYAGRKGLVPTYAADCGIFRRYSLSGTDDEASGSESSQFQGRRDIADRAVRQL